MDYRDAPCVNWEIYIVIIISVGEIKAKDNKTELL